MKLCDMCPLDSAVEAEVYQIRFDNLATEPGEAAWRGTLCRRHAREVRDSIVATAIATSLRLIYFKV